MKEPQGREKHECMYICEWDVKTDGISKKSASYCKGIVIATREWKLKLF